MDVIKRKTLRNSIWLAIVTFLLSMCSPSPQGYIILCVGDSLTAASYPRFLQRKFDQEGILTKVINFGRSGNTSGEYLAFLRKNKAVLSAEHPDFILIQLGTNDLREDLDYTSTVQFSENMTDIINIFREFKTRSGKTPLCLIATILPIPENSSFPFTENSQRRVWEEINPAIKQIADSRALILVDNYSLLLDQPSLLPDVHPSREGYRLIAQNWFHSLKPLMQ